MSTMTICSTEHPVPNAGRGASFELDLPATRPAPSIPLWEILEMEGWADLHRSAPPQLAAAEGIHPPHWVGGALAAVYRGADVLALNRVIGLGTRQAPRGEVVDSLLALYRGAGVRRFFVQVAPAGRHDELTRRLERRGFRLHNRWAKLVRGGGDVPAAETDLAIERLPAEKAGLFGELFAPEVGWPPAASRWLARTVGRPDWRHYAAFDGDRVAAAAALFLTGSGAWLSFAATHPDYRRRGAQAALLAHRIREASRAGASTLVVETAEDRPDQPCVSFRNCLRAGFRVAYLRPNWLWSDEDGG
jgi:GNAT superfamily N-acetyltransferase